VSYFSELFRAGTNMDMETCLSAVDQTVTGRMNHQLLAEFTVEEIEAAMHQMPPMKAPGSDGFSACFYQANWGTINTEVCHVVLHFLNTGELDNQLNKTYIALIPKVLKPECVIEFRPISLCNMMYKLILKVLANRLKFRPISLCIHTRQVDLGQHYCGF